MQHRDCVHTEDAYFVVGTPVLHKELIATTNVGIKIPMSGTVMINERNLQRHIFDVLAHQATASSAIFAIQEKRGDTTPGSI